MRLFEIAPPVYTTGIALLDHETPSVEIWKPDGGVNVNVLVAGTRAVALKRNERGGTEPFGAVVETTVTGPNASEFGAPTAVAGGFKIVTR
jgi:hypothetical protein